MWKCSFFLIKATHQGSTVTGQDRREEQQGAGRRLCIVTACWAEIMLIVERWWWILLSVHEDVHEQLKSFIGFYSKGSHPVTCFHKKQLWRDIRKSWFEPEEEKKARQCPQFTKLQRTQNYAYSIHRESAVERERVFNWGFIHLSCH